ncbi:MAG: glycosyltransferase family 9 protein [Bacteroidota bacterium]|nr:glycosyltransferase family 9 protein [Bacteroidota bacterium]
MNNIKIAIFRFSSIGDILLTTPVVRCLHLQLNAEIHYFTKAAFVSLLDTNPHIHKIHIFHSIKTARETFFDNSFDMVVDLHKNLRSRFVTLGFYKKIISYQKKNFAKWLLVNTKIDLLPNIGLVDRYFKQLEKINVLYDGKGLDVFLTDTAITEETKDYIALSLGGTYYTKKIPAEKWKILIDQVNRPIVLLGGSNEIKLAENLCQIFPKKDLRNMVGKSSLVESCILIKKARLLITGDTGMMHVAAATETPTFSIWGSTVPKFGFSPFFKDQSKAKKQSIIFETKSLGCRPCSKLGHYKCPKEHFHCMNQINYSNIAQQANAI